VPRLPKLVESEARVHERLEAVYVVLMRVRKCRTGQTPDVPVLVGVVVLGHELLEVFDGVHRGVAVAVDVDDHERTVGQFQDDAVALPAVYAVDFEPYAIRIPKSSCIPALFLSDRGCPYRLRLKFCHNPDHNPARVQGVQRGFGIDTRRENPAICGALGSCRTWIRTRTN
jgi:hypothetical protein